MTGGRRRTEDEGEILACVAGRDLPVGQAFRRLGHRHTCPERPRAGPQPAPVRPFAREAVFDCAAFLDSRRGIDDEHFAGPEPAAPDAGVRGEAECSRLRRAGDEAVVGNRVAKWTQAVPVEGRTDDATVGEDDPGGTVPGLDQRRVVAVERADVLVELRVGVDCLRNQHRGRVTHVSSAAKQQLECVVEQRGIRAVLFQCVAPRLHPGDVAVDRVDLAVVAQQPERLSALPGGVCVRREALMEDAERSLELGIAQIGIEGRELIGRAECLVRDGAERERDDVGARGRRLDALARPIGAGLRFVKARAERLQENELLDRRHRRPPLLSKRVGDDRNLTPAPHAQSFLSARLLDRRARVLVPEEDHPEPAPGAGDQSARQRQQDARAVAREPVGGDRPAVAHAREPFQEAVDDRTRGAAGRIGEEADPAGVALAAQVVDQRLHCSTPSYECGLPSCCCDLAGVGEE